MTKAATSRTIGAAALVAAAAAWAYYADRGLVLSHYDAKAHLVVARRVADSLTPGWQQLGAVWLPLPHLLQLLPTQIDWFYRTGTAASLVSVIAFACVAWSAAQLVLRLTGSPHGAVTAGALLLLNPNLLYLHSTPMTEPLLLATTFLVVLWTYEWVREGGRPPVKLQWALFAAMWTRYEAWPIVAVACVCAAYALVTKAAASAGGSIAAGVRAALPSLAHLAAWPVAAVLLFVINSRITVGAWFVTGGFYVPDPAYEDQAWRSLVAVWWGAHQMSAYAVVASALVAAAAIAVQAVARRRDAASLIPASLFAAAALPFYAFYSGHPFRIRYMVPVVAASALFAGIAVGMLCRGARPSPDEPAAPPGARTRSSSAAGMLLAAMLIASSLIESPPIGAAAPMVQEAQWDLPSSRERQRVTSCLAPSYRGDKVMASMGSLAHYMQELSREGFGISDFVHEGNGAIWELALDTGPAPHAGWMLVEEEAEGGDVLAQRIRADPAFTRGMVRVCEGGGVALYRRE